MANDPEDKIKEKQKLAVPRNKALIIGAGAALIALGAMAVSLYTLSLNQQVQNQLTDNHQFTLQLEKLTQEQNKIQDQIDTKIAEKTNDFEKNRSLLQNKFEALNNQLHTAMSQKFYQNQNWQLLKARYYLELAQINGHWSKNFDASIALLQQADQLLQQLSDPKVFDIRQAIAKDITQLQAQPKIDIAGILSQLDATQERLNELNLPSMLDEKPTTATSETSKKAISAWRLRLQDNMNLLSKLVIIRRNDEPIKPLLSPAFEALLKENIRLNLQEAQWAVLNDNPQVYQLVLNQALTTLKKNFNQNTQNTAALIKKLMELKQLPLTQEKPDIGSALPLLNQLINTQADSSSSSNQEQGGNIQ
jgi:uroporphyrin-3 C-methyltransferase